MFSRNYVLHKKDIAESAVLAIAQIKIKQVI